MAQEKLIIKNFGPIKDAEIELGKVTVFIGEQASGKSVLAKLVAIFKNRNSLMYPKNKLLSNFHLDSYLNENSYIKIQTSEYSIAQNNRTLTTFNISDRLKRLSDSYSNLAKNIIEELPGQNENYDRSVYELFKIERKNINNKIAELISTPVYIPTERILISLISKSLFSFLQEDKLPFPKYLLSFGNDYELAKIASNQIKIPFLNINFSSDENQDFIILESGKKLALLDVSSGFQSLIPLYLVVEDLSKEGNRQFIIEEPELNLYPTTQKKLVEYLAGKTDKNSLILTTHSPYILSSLDNLIQAGNVVKKHPELKDEVEKIIPSQYHLNYEDVKVYFVADGTARLIMNEEYQGIDVNELDKVSENLNEEFEKLLDLKYQD